VRKLLVASQKSGVGKTTTSLNLAAAAATAGARVLLLDADPLSTITGSLDLAEHPRRKSLRQAGFDLPGVLIRDFVPGLDIFSPYEAGRCSDADLDELLRLATSPLCQEGYGCLVVDTPPFLGAKPAQLLSVCDEFVVVMQAEPMAYRTLPAFLELVQRSRGENQQLQMRGILLTLPDGETPGGRWERELRGRFGNRILPHVIPYDEQVGKELQAHRIVSAAAPESPAGVAYHGLVASLGLAAERRANEEVAEAPLLAAAALFTPAVVGAKGPSFGLDLPESPVGEAPPEFEAAQEFRPPEEPAWRAEPPEEPEPRPEEKAPERQAEAERVEPLPGPKSGKFARPVVAPDKAPLPAVSPSANSKAVARAPEQPRETGFSPAAFLWVGLAVAVGVGLRFVKLPDFVLPIVVGVAVTAAVVLALRLFAGGQEKSETTAPARPLPPKSGVKTTALPGAARLTARPDSRPTNRRPSRPPNRREE
jgi:chromosome partitioning protein